MNITIVGLGVIGGSYALSLKDYKEFDIYGIDVNRDSLLKTKSLGIIKEGALFKSEESKEIIRNTDLIILCIYPKDIINFINIYKSEFKENLIITDVTGIKECFIESVLEILPEGIDFVFSHPMAGREKRGFEYASAEVFQKANFIITPVNENKEESLKLIEDLAFKMGFSNVKRISPKIHDEIIAFTSQLPHAIAVSLVNSDDLGIDTGKFVGDSYRELTRIAKINEELWSQLFLGNKENLINRIESFQRELEKIKRALCCNDQESLKTLFRNSTEKRENLE
ncbi:prephenate dehydrogenase [Clostridium sp. LIBA-8841]|uniref:prephenate dehydrogenase n=1 Tax=Clostridium sp. LIBA-8841 TaxID=2987530 RepID=UPI002AC3ADAB|nr:prephenate dehydrogenase [Clostridium sp. LIBA-8841]MDZ5254142.1 prephenate dehydrogenase [Clostridium sp. LIBA-8841]